MVTSYKVIEKNVEGSGRITSCHIQVHLSGKLHPYGDIISRSYKPTFHGSCYGSRLKGSSQEATLVLSNTRELDRELFYKLVYFI